MALSNQIEKNRFCSPNTWISLSNDILQEVLCIEKSIRKLDVPSFENRFQDILHKIQVLFNQANIDQQTSILLDHAPLRTYQREVILALLRLIITSRTLATPWETKTLKDHVLILCHDFRANLRSLVRERKVIERQVIENTFDPTPEKLNRKPCIEQIESKSTHSDISFIEDSNINEVQVKFELEPGKINVSNQQAPIDKQLLSTGNLKGKNWEDIDGSALHSPCSPNTDIKRCLNSSLHFNSTIVSVNTSESSNYNIKANSGCQPRDRNINFLNCKSFYKQVNTEESTRSESNVFFEIPEGLNGIEENQNLNGVSIETIDGIKNTTNRNPCFQSESDYNTSSLISVEKSFKQCDCGAMGNCLICLLSDSGRGSDSDSDPFVKIQEPADDFDKTNSFFKSSDENISKSDFLSCDSDSDYTSPRDVKSSCEDLFVLHGLQENKPPNVQSLNCFSSDDIEDGLLFESPVNDTDLSYFLYETQKTLDEIKYKMHKSSNNKEASLSYSPRQNANQFSESQSSLSVSSKPSTLFNHSFSPKLHPPPTALFFTKENSVDVPYSPSYDNKSIDETHTDSLNKYQTESKSCTSESSVSSFGFNQIVHPPTRISMLPNITFAHLKGDIEEEKSPLRDSEPIITALEESSEHSSLPMDDKTNPRKLSQKSPTFRCHSAMAVSTVHLSNDGTESVSSVYDAFSGKKDFYNLRRSLPGWKRRHSGVSTLNRTEDETENETRFFESDESMLFTKTTLSMEIKEDEEEIVQRQIKKAARIRSKALSKGTPLPPHPVKVRDASLCRKVLGGLIDNYSFQPITHMEELFVLAQNITTQRVEFIEALEDMIRSMITLFAILDSLGIPDFKKEVDVLESSIRFDILREFTLRKDTLYSDLDDVIGFAEYFDPQNSFEPLQNLSIILISMIKEYEGLLLISKYVLNHPKFIKIFTDNLTCFNSLYYDDILANKLIHIQETMKDIFSQNLLRREQEEQSKHPERMAVKVQRALEETEEFQRRNHLARLALKDKVEIADEQVAFCLMPGVQNLSASLSRITSRDTSISFQSNQKPMSLFSLDNSSKHPTPSRLSMNYVMFSKYDEGHNPSHRNSKFYFKNAISKKSSIVSLLAPIATRAIFESNPYFPLNPPRMDLTKPQFGKDAQDIHEPQFSSTQSEHVSLIEKDLSIKSEMNCSGFPLKHNFNSSVKSNSFSESVDFCSSSDFLVAIEHDTTASRNSILFNAEPVVDYSFNDSDGEIVIGNVVCHPVVLTRGSYSFNGSGIFTPSSDDSDKKCDFVSTRLDFSANLLTHNLEGIHTGLASTTPKNSQDDESDSSSLLITKDQRHKAEPHSSKSSISMSFSDQTRNCKVSEENTSMFKRPDSISSNKVPDISPTELDSSLEKRSITIFSNEEVGLDESASLHDMDSLLSKESIPISQFSKTKNNSLVEVPEFVYRSNCSLNPPVNFAVFSDFSFSLEADHNHSIPKMASFDANYDPSILQELNSSSNINFKGDSHSLNEVSQLSLLSSLEVCSTPGYKSPRNSLMTLNSIDTGSISGLFKDEEMSLKSNFYESTCGPEKNELASNFYTKQNKLTPNTATYQFTPNELNSGLADLNSKKIDYPQFLKPAHSQYPTEQILGLETTDPFSDPHVFNNIISQSALSNSGSLNNSEYSDSIKNITEHTKTLHGSPKSLNTKMIEASCFTCTCKKAHVCDPASDSTSIIQPQSSSKGSEHVSLTSCSTNPLNKIDIIAEISSASCFLDDINNSIVEVEAGLNQSYSKSKRLSPEPSNSASFLSEPPFTVLFVNNSFKAVSNLKDPTENSSVNQSALYLPFNSSGHDLTSIDTLFFSNSREDSLSIYKNWYTPLRRHSISGAIHSELNIHFNGSRSLVSKKKCYSTKILPSQLKDTSWANASPSLDYSIKLSNQPRVQRLESSSFTSEHFSPFLNVSKVNSKDDTPSKKFSRPESCGDLEGLYDSSSPMRSKSNPTNTSLNKPINKMKKLLVGVKNRQVFGKPFLTYVAPHGVEFLANAPVPLNPHCAGREKEKNPKASRKISRTGPHNSHGPGNRLSNLSTYSDDSSSVLGSRKQSQDSSLALGSRKQSLDSGSFLGSRKQSQDGLKAVALTQTHLDDVSSTISGLDKKEPDSTADKEVANNLQSENFQVKSRRLSKSGFTEEVDIPWFLEHDYSSSDIVMKDGLILNATLEALIERLTLHDEAIDSKFVETFLLTFRSFSNASEFLEMLIKRYNNLPPSGLAPDQLIVWVTKKQTAIRIRVNNILKTWLESYFYESDDSGCLERLIAFCSCDMMQTMPSAAKRILVIAGEYYEKLRLESSNAKLTKSKTMDLMAAAAIAKLPNEPPPTPLVPRWIASSLSADLPFRIIDLNPLEVARQLTIMDYRAYSLIRPHELIGLEFSKKSSTSVEHVRSMTEATNEITSLLCECILKEKDIKKRCILIKYFITLGSHLLQLKNFNSLMPIVGALNSSMVARLKKTWGLLPPKSQANFANLRKATDHSKNYAIYRNVLKMSMPPCLPFLGICLTDLTFTDEGNAAFKEDDAHKKQINFAKYYRTVAIVQEIQKFQVPYNLIEVRELQTRLKSWMKSSNAAWDEDSFYNISLQLEPRNSNQPALTVRSRSQSDATVGKTGNLNLVSQAYF